MTLRECAIVTAYTGVAMLAGKDLGELYRYAEEITGISPVYTHYFADDDFNEKLHELSRTDFIELCKKASEPKGDIAKIKILLDREEVFEAVERITNEAIEKGLRKSTIQKSLILEIGALKPAKIEYEYENYDPSGVGQAFSP